MKITILLLGLILSCLINVSNGQICCNKNTVQVKGLGVNRIKPDIAKLYAYMTVFGTTAQQALSRMDTKLNKMINQDLFYLINDYDFQSSQIGYYPYYNQINNTKQFVGYIVSTYLTVLVRNIEFYDTIIARVIDIMMNEVAFVYKISFETEDPSGGKVTAKTNVQTDAFYDALSKAQQYAKAIGLKLGKITLIEEKFMQNYPLNELGGKYTEADYSNTDEPNLYGDIPIIPVGTVPLLVQTTVIWQLVQ